MLISLVPISSSERLMVSVVDFGRTFAASIISTKLAWYLQRHVCLGTNFASLITVAGRARQYVDTETEKDGRSRSGFTSHIVFFDRQFTAIVRAIHEGIVPAFGSLFCGI